MIPAILTPLTGLLWRNPWKTALGICIIALVLFNWRTNYLTEKFEDLKATVSAYQEAIKTLQEDSARRDEVTKRDAKDSIQSEIRRAEALRRIAERKSDEEEFVDPVIGDSIDWLYSQPHPDDGRNKTPGTDS